MSLLRSLCCAVGFHNYRRFGSDELRFEGGTKLVWKKCRHCGQLDILPEDY